jgi:CBS domain-containing protein
LGGKPVSVREIMCPDPITTTPETDTTEAIALMRSNKLGCLPVVQDEKLVGIVTESDFMDLSTKLLDEWLRAE